MARRNLIRIGVTALALAGVGAGMAAAAPKGPGRAQIVEKLSACRQVTDPTQRLACYDQAAAAFDQAEKAGDLVVADKAQIREVKKQAFGLNLTQALTVFDRGDKPEKVDEVTLTVERASLDENNRWVLRMEGGQVWRQIDGDVPAKDPKKGSQARITRGSLGSYFINVDGQPSFRAHRDE